MTNPFYLGYLRLIRTKTVLFLIVFISCLILAACGSSKKTTTTNVEPADETLAPDFLENLLRQRSVYINDILNKKDSLGIQIIYTRINRDIQNRPSLKNFYFNVSDKYFYPASTVKMPIALLALERLNELNVQGLNKNSTMITEANYSGQTAVYNDPTTADGRPTIEHYIKKIFLVSDNDAFNRLYEFMGQEYINKKLHEKGYKDAQILHRLSIALSEEENRQTNSIKFFDTSAKLLFSQLPQRSNWVYANRNDKMGIGFMRNDKVVQEPFDFSKKNRIRLTELHSVLQSIIFPSTVSEKQRFNITEEDRRFVSKYMSQLPSETNYPQYDTSNYWDAYVKFLYYGSEKGKLPKTLRIFNKVGDAYGFLIDVAYVVDFENKVEFMLSSVIYCNSDGIFNDDKYDYDAVGFPFMKNLGQIIYDYELHRRKKFAPDFSLLKFTYDK